MSKTAVLKFGRNPDVGNGTWEDVWNRGGTYQWPTVAGKLKVSSASTADTSTGWGARSIRVEGLDANFVELTEDIDLTGTSTTTGTQSFLRVNRAYVLDAGTYGTLAAGGNRGTITINTTADVAVAGIEFSTGTPSVGFSQTEVARYTVPNGSKAYITGWDVQIDGSKPADLCMFVRRNADVTSAPFTAARIQVYYGGVSGEQQFRPLLNGLGPFFGATDIWWSCRGDGVATQATVFFEIDLEMTDR